jgi:ATP-dependent phosphofructokinase / diphosphate-dependent phosphofructokinase
MPSFVIAQGGGPTAVINQTLCGAIAKARELDPGLRVLGARHGVRGLVSGDVVDLSRLSDDDLRRLAGTPNSGLGSTRDKPDPKSCDAILAALDKLDARAFVYIGGNDTAGTLELLRGRASGSCRFVHAPKTIDNDLEANDHVPGFISAATFVAQAFASVDLDFRAMPGIYVGIVMGRHAGFLTAAPAAWQDRPDAAPHLVYAPEQPFGLDRFLDQVAEVYGRLGRCIVAMSEGVQDEAGLSFAEALVTAGLAERDQHGNVQLTGGDLGLEIQRALKERFPKARARVDTFGYLPRGFLGVIDPTDSREAYAAGAQAAASAFEDSGSVVLEFDGARTTPKLVPLDRVAGRTRHMPESFFAGPQRISDEGRHYLQRLLPARPDLFTPFV